MSAQLLIDVDEPEPSTDADEPVDAAPVKPSKVIKDKSDQHAKKDSGAKPHSDEKLVR